MTVRWTRTDDDVWRAVVDRPRVRNAIDFATMKDLERLVEEVGADDTARVLTLRGAGDAFVSGGDLREFAQLEDREEVARMSRRMKKLLVRIEQLDCWTVACVNGAAFGGGWELALAFDMRIASAGARFGFVQANLAIPPGWGGLTRLVRTVGRSQALLWLGSAATVGAEQAYRTGLVDDVAPPRRFAEHVDETIQQLASTSPQLIRALKQGAHHAESLTPKEALQRELEPFCDLWGNPEHRRRLEKFTDSDN